MNGCAMNVIVQTSQVQLAKMKLNKNYTLVLTVDALNFTKGIAANGFGLGDYCLSQKLNRITNLKN